MAAIILEGIEQAITTASAIHLSARAPEINPTTSFIALALALMSASET
jgi:hypothetical protein